MHADMVTIVKKVTSLVALCFVDLSNEVEKIKIRYFTALGVISPFCRRRLQ
jgi:hypothetical protein